MEKINKDFKLAEKKTSIGDFLSNCLAVEGRSLLSYLPGIIAIIDYHEKIWYMNRYLRVLLELEQEETFNLELKNILTIKSLFHIRRKYLSLLKNNAPIYFNEIEIVSKQGNLIPIIASAQKFYDQNELSGFLVMGFPITNFNLDITQLKQENRSLIKFISLIAHDMRNPFNSLIGFSGLLLENYDAYKDNKRKEYIQHIYTASNQGIQLLDNLLEWSHVSLGTIDPIKVQFNLKDLIIEVSKSLGQSFVKKEIELLLLLDENITVYADQNMIKTVIRNLLSNAVKFSHRKGKVSIKTIFNHNYAYIEIKDNGIGMSQNQLDKQFKIGEKIVSRGTEGEKGSGLGLILCKEFVEINNGKMLVYSKLGQGTTFKIKLPLVKPS